MDAIWNILKGLCHQSGELGGNGIFKRWSLVSF